MLGYINISYTLQVLDYMLVKQHRVGTFQTLHVQIIEL